MDDRDVAQEPDLDVVRLEVRDRDGLRGLRQERLPVDERAVGIRAEEVVRQDLVEATDIRVLDGANVVPVQAGEGIELGFGGRRQGRSHLAVSEYRPDRHLNSARRPEGAATGRPRRSVAAGSG